MPAVAASLAGRCHCGNLEVSFATRQRPEQLEVRACACSFCARHGARCVSDPGGEVRITVHDPRALIRYRFALETADFLVCGRCGIYVAAVLAAAGGRYAIINVNALDEAARCTRPPVAVRYDAESEAERRARRAARWTPVAAFSDAAGRPL